jgi:hypothetical protein
MPSINETKKPNKGRPKVDTEAVNLRLPRDLIEALVKFRKDQPDLPNAPEGIRRILVEALTAKGYLIK